MYQSHGSSGKDWHSIFSKQGFNHWRFPRLSSQFGSPCDFWQSGLPKPSRATFKTTHDSSLFFHHFFILFIVACVFLEHKSAGLTQFSSKKRDASDTFVEKKLLSQEISTQFRVDKPYHHSSPLYSRKFPGQHRLVAVVITEPQMKEMAVRLIMFR